MNKLISLIHKEYQYNESKTKHNKTMYIFHGIYCTLPSRELAVSNTLVMEIPQFCIRPFHVEPPHAAPYTQTLEQNDHHANCLISAYWSLPKMRAS